MDNKNLKLNKKDIINLLPHKEQMLLNDDIYDINNIKTANAVVNVKKTMFYVQRHYT